MERKMKDSGHPWIGKIPEHWELHYLRGIANAFRKGNGITKEDLDPDGDILCVRYGDLYTKYNHCITTVSCRTNVSAIQNAVYSTYGDIYFTCSREDVDLIGKSAAFLCDEPCLVGGDLIIMRHNQNPRFLGYSLDSYVSQKQKSYGKSKLKVVHTSVKDLKNVAIALPPLAEQERIVSYLDEKCGEIDELIDVEQQMISDLESYRQAVITEAVTHGLNPDVQNKQSTIQGIKDIPSNWNEVNLLKVIYLRARLGWRGLKAEEYVDEGYPFLSAFNIVNNQLVWENLNFINQLRYDESPEIKLSLHDILIVKDGAGIGKCARVENMPLGESTVNSSLGVITVSETLYYSYLYYFFLSTPFQDNVLFLKNGMGVPHLTQENLKSVRIPLPPVDEQKTIANFLDSKCSEIDGLIKVKQEKIETLKQYRQSLIFEAVTGKTPIIENL